MANTPQRSGKPGERLGRGLDELAIAPGHVVAAQDDQVGPLRHEQLRPRG